MVEMLLIGMFIVLTISIFTGHPLAFVLGGVATIFGLIGWNTSIFNVFTIKFYDSMISYSLVAIPMFILMANFLTASNVAEGLFDAARYLFGPVKGGLGVAVVVVSTIFAASTGIVGASVVTMGMLGLPILLKHGYNKELAVGSVAAGGTLGILIPPSIMLVLMGSYAQISVGKLFLAAIVPGLMLSLFYIIYIIIICRIHPEYGPAISAEEAAEMPVPKRIKNALINMIPPLFLILGVLGSIFSGIATATEASAVGATFALILTIIYKQFSIKMVKSAVINTAKTTAMIYVLMLGANAFTAIFLGLDGSIIVVNLVKSMGLSNLSVLILMIAVTFFLGMFIDWVGIVMIVFPVFLPLLDSFGFDRLWVVGLSAVILQSSFMTPPFGFSLFYMKGIAPANITLGNIYRGIIPFVFMIIIVTILCIIWPDILLMFVNKGNL